MGLREINARRTRGLIVDGAMELFFAHGYDATTMEDVARHVGIGNSTLYRYFPTKEQLATAPIGEPDVMAVALAGRPAEESPEVALGHALVEFLAKTSENADQAKDFQRLVNEAPRLGVRLLEWLAEAHQHLAAALAARRGLPPDDLSSAATAGLAIFVLQRVDLAVQGGDTRDGFEIIAEVMARLQGSPPLLPSPVDAP